MEGALEMDNLRAALAFAGSEVFAHLPIHCGFEGIFDRQSAAFNKKITFQRGPAHDSSKRLNEGGVLYAIDVGVGELHLGGDQ